MKVYGVDTDHMRETARNYGHGYELTDFDLETLVKYLKKNSFLRMKVEQAVEESIGYWVEEMKETLKYADWSE